MKDKTPVTLAWQNLNVLVPKPKNGLLESWSLRKGGKSFKNVLQDVSGIAQPGSFLAVMGASGSGKTTLMNVLAGKSDAKMVVDGNIRVNGLPTDNICNISGFVHQHDLFFGTLTVYEHLYFMAKLKLSSDLSSMELDRILQSVMTELSLTNCEQTRIGIPGQVQGLSGGERKRLAFAGEILTDPPILFLDEPTTGLDSFSAQKLVEMMKDLASRGKTILCTIHQPSSDIFCMFDQLLLLAEGQVAYLGNAGSAPAFFQTLDYNCPVQYNPADYYTKVLAICPGREKESREGIRRICESFRASESYRSLEKNIESELSSAAGLPKHCLNADPLWITQLVWLTWRAGLNSYRNPSVHMLRTFQKFLVAILLGACYFGVQLNQLGIQDVQGVVFVFIAESTYPSLYGVLNVFPKDLPLFLREYKSGLYRTDTHYLSTMLSLLPGFIFEPLLFITIAYWFVGLRATVEAFISTCAVVILTANVAAACGMFFSAAFEDITIAITLMLPIDILLKVTGGIFINIRSLPSYISWVQYISWFSYSNEAATVAQWSGVTNISCDGAPAILCVPDGDQVIDDRDFSASHLPMDFGGLLALYLLFHSLAYIAIVVRCRK